MIIMMMVISRLRHRKSRVPEPAEDASPVEKEEVPANEAEDDEADDDNNDDGDKSSEASKIKSPTTAAKPGKGRVMKRPAGRQSVESAADDTVEKEKSPSPPKKKTKLDPE